jgi:hypothetical protein
MWLVVWSSPSKSTIAMSYEVSSGLMKAIDNTA